MSLLSNLQVYEGSKRTKKRKGRGDGSGKGGTSGRGHKGQRARKSGNRPAGFEGGAMPLARRLPKFGFSNAPFKTLYQVINLSQLKNWSGSEVTPELLAKKSWIRKDQKIKILAQGEISKPLQVSAHKFSKKAKELIEKAGGKAHILTSVENTPEDRKTKTKSLSQKKLKDSALKPENASENKAKDSTAQTLKKTNTKKEEQE